MTKDEFIAKELIVKRYQTSLTLFWFAGMSIFFVWSYLAAGKIDMHWASLPFQICLFTYIGGGFFAFLWLSTRRMKQLGMFCPECKWQKFFLYNAGVKQRILTTGKCKCGHNIIESNDLNPMSK